MVKPMCRYTLAGLRYGSSVWETLHLKNGSSLLHCTYSLPSSKGKASIPNLSAATTSLWLLVYAMAIIGRCHTGGAFMFELEHGCDTAIKSLRRTLLILKLWCWIARGVRLRKIVAALLLEHVFRMGSNAISDFLKQSLVILYCWCGRHVLRLTRCANLCLHPPRACFSAHLHQSMNAASKPLASSTPQRISGM
jgi:hypothetical protein